MGQKLRTRLGGKRRRFNEEKKSFNINEKHEKKTTYGQEEGDLMKKKIIKYKIHAKQGLKVKMGRLTRARNSQQKL